MNQSHTSVSTYLAVYVALLALLVLTLGAAYAPLGSFKLVAALAIAGTKAILIILYFMHVKGSNRLLQAFVGAGFLWLLLLVLLTLIDYLNRPFAP